MRGTPETWAKLPPLPDVMGMIMHDLDASVHRARRAGVDRARIVIDPGLGFGKRKEQNSEILARLQSTREARLPDPRRPVAEVLPGTSHGEGDRLRHGLGGGGRDLGGRHIVRVHDVREMRVAAGVADAVSNMTGE